MKTLTKKRKMVDVSTLVKKAEDLYVPLDFKENHAYFSKPDGTGAYHGVTSILRVIAKPALIQWAANMACDYIIEKCKKEGLVRKESFPEVVGSRELEWYSVESSVLEEARTAHTKKKEKAGEQGSDVHAQIESIVKDAINDFVDPGVIKTTNIDRLLLQPQVVKFIDWAADNNVRFLESEKIVYSKESHYAGTCDLVLEIDGKKYIADVKTSSGIYPEFYLQMAAYQGALEEMGEHEDIAGAMVINLDKKGGFEIGMNYDYSGNRLAFLAALMLYKQLESLK